MRLLLVVLLLSIYVLYIVISPRDTVAELKSVFDWRVIRRGLRFRFPRRLRWPTISLPPIRFSVSGLIVATTCVAIYLAVMRAKGEPLDNVAIIAAVIVGGLCLAVLIAWNAQSRGVLRKQRSSYRPSKSKSTQTLPSITVDPRHEAKPFKGAAFPEMKTDGTDEPTGHKRVAD